MRKAVLCDEIVFPDGIKPGCLILENGKFSEILNALPSRFAGETLDCRGSVVLAGLVDTHVHINEPGRTDWEGFETATQAAAAGGITTLVDMPLNCIPVTTTAANLREKLNALSGKLWVDTGFWGGVTPESMPDLPDLLRSGILGVKSFLIDSGISEFPPMDAESLKPAMKELARAGLPYLFHAELEAPAPALASGSNYGQFVKTRPTSWENSAIRLLIRLAQETGCRTHIVHLSSAEALESIERAQKSEIPITAETCPHYLLLSEEEIDARPFPKSNGLFKCCPPIRSSKNNQALWRGLKSGILSFVVSDHSPCTANLKCLESGDLSKAWGGIASLQFGLSLIWSQAKIHDFGLQELTRWMSAEPAKMAGIFDHKGSISVGKDADFLVFDPKAQSTLTSQEILFKNKISPYLGKSVHGRVLKTFLRGEACFEGGAIRGKPQGKPILRST